MRTPSCSLREPARRHASPSRHDDGRRGYAHGQRRRASTRPTRRDHRRGGSARGRGGPRSLRRLDDLPGPGPRRVPEELGDAGDLLVAVDGLELETEALRDVLVGETLLDELANELGV